MEDGAILEMLSLSFTFSTKIWYLPFLNLCLPMLMGIQGKHFMMISILPAII